MRGLAPSVALLNQGDVAFLARDFAGARNLYQSAIKEDPQQARSHLRMAQLHISQNELEDAAAVLETALRFVGTDFQLKAQIYFLKAMVVERGPKIELARASWNAFATFAQAASDPLEAPAVSAKDQPAAALSGNPGESGAAVGTAELGPAVASGAASSEPGASGQERSPATDASELEAAVGRESGAPLVFAGTVSERKRMILAREKTAADAEKVKERIAKRYQEAQAEGQQSK